MIEDRQHSEVDEGAADDSGVGADKRAAGGLSIEDYEGQRVLMQDGAILSVALGDADPSFGYWTAMLPEGRPRSALLLGLGAGTLAHMLTRRFAGIRIVGAFASSHARTLLRNAMSSGVYVRSIVGPPWPRGELVPRF